MISFFRLAFPESSDADDKLNLDAEDANERDLDMEEGDAMGIEGLSKAELQARFLRQQ